MSSPRRPADPCLAPTAIIDSDHPAVRDYAEAAVGASRDPADQAVALYLAVRDPIRYDPYVPFHLPEHYRASNVLLTRKGFCVLKASLLCALGRACGIPSRLGFADVRNHLATRQFLDFLGSDLFVYHGWVEFHLAGRWVKATPAFNKELCEKHGVSPLEFNGRHDSVFQSCDPENNLFMEYVTHRGTSTDVPVEQLVTAWEEAYGKERVGGWTARYSRSAK